MCKIVAKMISYLLSLLLIMVTNPTFRCKNEKCLMNSEHINYGKTTDKNQGFWNFADVQVSGSTIAPTNTRMYRTMCHKADLFPRLRNQYTFPFTNAEATEQPSYLSSRMTNKI
jgi:hypothetical protein